MKKALVLVLALLMCVALVACNSATPGASSSPSDSSSPSGEESSSPSPSEDYSADFSGDVTINVMLLPAGEMNNAAVDKVTTAVNDRIKALGYDFKVKFAFTGVAWAWKEFQTAIQTGDNLDIIPAHTWSEGLSVTVGAQTGQYLRLDDPDNNLIEKYAPNLYATTSSSITDAAKIPGTKGVGYYSYVIEKDAVSQLGYLVNTSVLTDLGFTLDDFKATDLASWEPILKAFKEKYPNKFPLNIEAEVLDRTVNYISYAADNNGPLGVQFDNNNPEGTTVAITSRYESPGYKDFLNTMRGYYNAKYVDPDQGIEGDVSSSSFSKRRLAGDYLISTCVYVPGYEQTMAASASDSQGKTVEIAWAEAWSKPIATPDTALGSGLAIYSGTKYAPECAAFLNMLASDKIMGDLVSSGIEGENYTITNKTEIMKVDEETEELVGTGEFYADGIFKYTDGRGGWAPWRYGVAACATSITPVADNGKDGKELENMKAFNAAGAALNQALLDLKSVTSDMDACRATIKKYAIPLGSGALDPAQYDTFLTELKASGLQKVLDEAASQQSAWVS